jgi:uncharacterized protein YbjT (DUF2867 family)
MATLVIGGTGTVGGATVQELLKRGDTVRVMTRDESKTATLPSGVAGVVGDLADPPTLQGVFDGIDNVMLITVVHPDETRHGLNAVKAMKKQGVERVVYNSVMMEPGTEKIPHFGSKIPIEGAIKESGMEFTIVRPNNFHQNEYWYKDAILQHGIYPQPLGPIGCSRIDVRDIAEAAVAALTTDKHIGKTYNLNGPDLLTGKGTAKMWTDALGTEVNYMGDDLESWAEAASQGLPAWMVADFKIMYGYFIKHGLKAQPGDIETLTEVLGHSPRSFSDFIAETAEEWKSEKAAAK